MQNKLSNNLKIRIMKQRLLLSLLMLFVSVGLVKAADDYEPITIVVKAGEKATITFQNEGKGFVARIKQGHLIR